MLKVEGPETTAAITRARHHTPGTVPFILEVAVTLLLGCPLARDPHTHRLKQSRPGAESYGLYLEDGRQFHFRPGPGNHAAQSIAVFDRYRNGQLVVELDSPEAIWDFFGSLTNAPG
jgi:hypothetical protein